MTNYLLFFILLNNQPSILLAEKNEEAFVILALYDIYFNPILFSKLNNSVILLKKIENVVLEKGYKEEMNILRKEFPEYFI